MCTCVYAKRERERESQFNKESGKKKVKAREERRERREKREIFEKSDRALGKERGRHHERYFPRAFFLKEKRTKETSECIIIIIIIENTYPRGDVCVHPVCV